MAVETRFPRWADSPTQFLIWEVDEVIPVAFCFILFLPSRNLVLGLIIGIVLMKMYVKLKERMPPFFYFHYMWFWGILKPRGNNMRMPKGYITVYRE